MSIYKSPRIQMNSFGKVFLSTKQPSDFTHLLGMSIPDVVLFENSTEYIQDQGAIILPRHYFIFNGTIDGALQYKPYEFNQYRIVVSTYNGSICSIDSIG